MAYLVGQNATHYFELGTLSMSDDNAAMAGAMRAEEDCGLHGFQIVSRVMDHELSDALFDPLYCQPVKLNTMLMIQPLGFSHGQRLADFFMGNPMGQPLEEIMATNHLIFGAVLDRHLKRRILIMHRGNYFPFFVGRMDHAWAYRHQLKCRTSKRPSDYPSSLSYDTCVFRRDHLKTLVDVAGADRVMLVSDFLFDIGDPYPLETVEKAGLTPEARKKVCSETAHGFFRMPQS